MNDLLKILLSGVLGGALASILTHTFSYHRERRKVLTEKLEQLLQALDQLEERVLSRHLVLTTPQAAVPSAYQMGADDIMNRMTTLVALYFPEMNDALVEIFEANDAYVSASHNLIVNPSFTTADVNELKENGNRILSEAIGLRVRILGEADALSGKAIPVLLKWWEKKCSAQ